MGCMAEARRRSARAPGRGLPAVLAAVVLTVGCSTRDDAVSAPPTDTTAPAATGTAPSRPPPDTASSAPPPDTTTPATTWARTASTASPPDTSSGAPPPDTTAAAPSPDTASSPPPPDATASGPPDGTTPVGAATASSGRATDTRAGATMAPPAVDSTAVLAALDAAASPAGGSLAAVVLDGRGAELVVTPDADEPRYTASLSKLLVVQQLLARDAAGELTLTADDTALMQRALIASDDRAMSLLWHRWDGAELVTTGAALFGLTGTGPPSEPGRWGEVVTTARDQATFLAALGSQLPPGELAAMTSWLRVTTDRAADGFAQDFGLLSPTAGTADPVAAKQGWMCCVDSTRQLHSVGVLADGRVVVLLGDFPAGTTWGQARAALDAAAQAVVTGT